MKKFVAHSMAIVMLVIGLMFLFDRIYTATYSTSIPRNKIQFILKMEPQKVDYVFLGSSRVANNIATSEIRKITGKTALNLGIEGAVFEDNLLEVKLLISRKIKVKTIFLQVDYLFNHHGLSTIGNAAVLPFSENPVVKTQLEENMPDFPAINYIPFYRYMTADHAIGFREFFFAAIGKKPKKDLEHGFVPKSGQSKLQPLDLPETISKSNKTLEEIKAACKKNNIELILFCAPFCSQTNNIAYVDKLKLKLPELRDYSRSMGDELFYDCGHLNEKGAILFTKMLVTDLCGDDLQRAAVAK